MADTEKSSIGLKSPVEDEAPTEANDSTGAESTVQLRPEESLYLKEERLLASPPPMALMARDLAAFFRISTAIGQVRDLEELRRSLLELLGEVIPAAFGAIVLVGEPAQPDTTFCWHRDDPPRQRTELDEAILAKALRGSEALLTQVGSGDAGHSVLCLPLRVADRLLGAIYFGSSGDRTRFDEDHLQFLTAISGVLAVALENTRNIDFLRSENEQLREARGNLRHDMVGSSRQILQVQRTIAKVAPTDSTVLITGESGTGKELAARAIHINSPRVSGPFLAINCAALSESLLESELFGHEKGAFTGAVRRKKGKLEMADRGTLFLDEVADMTPALQAKLLRVLQESEFERVGADRSIRVDIRLIAATNRSLEEAMACGTFRDDLYYRLCVVRLKLPPLRDRVEDIPLLARTFARRHSAACTRRVLGIGPEAEDCLVSYSWPGNVRELENAIESALVMGNDEFIQPEDLPERLLESVGYSHGKPARFQDAVRQFKRELIVKTLRRAGGSYQDAARILEVHPNYLHRLVTQLGLRKAP